MYVLARTVYKNILHSLHQIMYLTYLRSATNLTVFLAYLDFYKYVEKVSLLSWHRPAQIWWAPSKYILGADFAHLQNATLQHFSELKRDYLKVFILTRNVRY